MAIDIEQEIQKAIEDGLLLDKRSIMPSGKDSIGRVKRWPNRPLDKILGCCIHQNAGGNDPVETAKYHTSKQNHITPGRPLPSICYHIAIPDGESSPWLVANPAWRTYSQGFKGPGDENTHLISILVMGDFYARGHQGSEKGPSSSQILCLNKALEWVKKTFGFGNEGIFGHYHFGKAQCPGYFLEEYIETLRKDAPDLKTIGQWQRALLRWNPKCLPKYGDDGQWGEESKRALVRFQTDMKIQVTGVRDPFTELMLIRRYSYAI